MAPQPTPNWLNSPLHRHMPSSTLVAALFIMVGNGKNITVLQLRIYDEMWNAYTMGCSSAAEKNEIVNFPVKWVE